MYRLLEFLRSISLLLLFLSLEVVAILFYAHSNSYTQAKIFGYTAGITGAVGKVTSGAKGYLSLREKNDLLIDRIMELEGELSKVKSMHSDSLLAVNSLSDERGATYLSARVVRNSTNKSRNFLLLNRGLTSGVRERMAVVTPYGEVVGVVVGCSERYSVVMSILNRDFNSSGMIETGTHVGGISWDGENRHVIQLDELSKYANIFEGAEVLTAGLSQTFPRGLKIGRIRDYALKESEGSYFANIELAADISALDEVVIINQALLEKEQDVMDLFIQEGKIESEYDELYDFEQTEFEQADSTLQSEEAVTRQIIESGMNSNTESDE